MLVECTRLDSVVLLRLNRPLVLNASNLPLKRELLAALREIAGWSDVTGLVLTGAGRAFCVGGDLKERPTLDEAAHREALDLQQAICRTLRGLDIVTIAAVNGYALGGGLEMVLSCDIRIASPSAVFGAPVGETGSLSTGGLHSELPAAVGSAWATDLILTGRKLDAGTALNIGLVTRVDATPLDAAIALAAGIAGEAVSIRSGKRVLALARTATAEAVMAAETELCLTL